MSQTRNLPSHFAILRPTSGGGPSYQLCSSVDEHVHSTRLGELDRFFQSVKNLRRNTTELHAAEFMREDTTSTLDTHVYETSVRNEEDAVTDVRKVKWWFLPHTLKLPSGQAFPVLEASRRFFLSQRFLRVIPLNVNSIEMQATVGLYERIRQERLGEPAILRDPPALRMALDQYEWALSDHAQRRARHRSPRPEREIPVFVRELLIKNALDKNEACAITLVPLSQIPVLGITPCFHIFEYSSIQRWKDEHHKCPSCRTEIATVHEYQNATT